MRGYDLTNALWRKSSYSGGSGGESCVEVADEVPGAVPVRDSKVEDSPVLLLSASAWADFLDAIRH
ncbi:DUF397 domain-containing protein [Streptomyces griseoluteus]|uniref:DUF397 domain-containing protein n=1 Tax=Streptomyces griseoluteus TaxID=29306 RepID=UPI0037F35EFD